NSDEEWRQINAILAKAGKARLSTYQFNPTNPKDFDTNLRAVLGNLTQTALDNLFNDVPDVANIYDAYLRRNRDDVLKAGKERLYLDKPDFEAMMQIKVRIDAQWAEINRILTDASRRKGSPKQFTDPTAFDQNLAAALGPIKYPTQPEAVTSLDMYFRAFQI